MIGLDIGDEVTVCYSDGSEMKGIVRHYPQQAGEVWVIESPGHFHYIQHFDAIVKAKK